MFREPLMVQCVPVASDLRVGTSKNSLALSSLLLPFRYLYKLMRSPEPSLLPAVSVFLTGEVLQSLNHFSCPSLDSLQYVHASLVLRNALVTAGQ